MLLFETGANVNLAGRSSVNPLQAAAAPGHSSVVDVLLNAKADMEAKDGTGLPPLHMVLKSGF